MHGRMGPRFQGPNFQTKSESQSTKHLGIGTLGLGALRLRLPLQTRKQMFYDRACRARWGVSGALIPREIEDDPQSAIAGLNALPRISCLGTIRPAG